MYEYMYINAYQRSCSLFGSGLPAHFFEFVLENQKKYSRQMPLKEQEKKSSQAENHEKFQNMEENWKTTTKAIVKMGGKW